MTLGAGGALRTAAAPRSPRRSGSSRPGASGYVTRDRRAARRRRRSSPAPSLPSSNSDRLREIRVCRSAARLARRSRAICTRGGARRPRARRTAIATRDRDAKRAAHRAAKRLPAARVGGRVERQDAGGAQRVRGADHAADIARILHAARGRRRAHRHPSKYRVEWRRPPLRRCATTPLGVRTGLAASMHAGLRVITRHAPSVRARDRAMRAVRSAVGQ